MLQLVLVKISLLAVIGDVLGKNPIMPQYEFIENLLKTITNLKLFQNSEMLLVLNNLITCLIHTK